ASDLHDVQLDLSRFPAGAVSSGSIELSLDETDRVIRAPSIQGGAVALQVPFLVSAERAEFAAFLESDGAPPIALAEDRTAWIGARKVALVVERRGRPAMRIRLGDGRTQDLRADEAELRFPLELPTDGLRTVEVQSTRFDTAGQSLADQPDTRRIFR